MSDLLQPFWIDCFGECDTNENINLEIYMTSGSFYRVSSFKKSRRFVVLIILYQSSWGFLKIRKKISVQKPFQQTYVLMKTSWRRLSSSSSEDVLIKMNIFALVIRLQKTSSRRLDQDQYIRLGHTSSRRLQDVLQKRLQDIFKTSCKDAFKMFWRRIIRLNCLPSSRICLGHTSEKFMVSVENLQVWYILA